MHAATWPTNTQAPKSLLAGGERGGAWPIPADPPIEWGQAGCVDAARVQEASRLSWLPAFPVHRGTWPQCQAYEASLQPQAAGSWGFPEAHETSLQPQAAGSWGFPAASSCRLMRLPCSLKQLLSFARVLAGAGVICWLAG